MGARRRPFYKEKHNFVLRERVICPVCSWLTIDVVCTTATSSVSSLLRLTQGFANIDADLMSLLHLSPRSIFDVGAGDGTCSEVESLLAETRRLTRCVHALCVANDLCVANGRKSAVQVHICQA